jgi:hypothetical protein
LDFIKFIEDYIQPAEREREREREKTASSWQNRTRGEQGNEERARDGVKLFITVTIKVWMDGGKVVAEDLRG